MNRKPPEPPHGNRPDPRKPDQPGYDDGHNGDEVPHSNSPRVWLLVGVGILIALFFLMGGAENFSSEEKMSITELVDEIDANRVASITQNGEKVKVELVGGETRIVEIQAGTEIVNLLHEEYEIPPDVLRQIDIAHKSGNTAGAVLLQILFSFLPVLLIVWLIWRLSRSLRAGPDQAISFGRSRARVTRDAERPQVAFQDVAGADEAKEELKEVVEFLKEPDKFVRLGARVPKGVLMVGAPGTGKTLMARAVAGEAGVPFFSISGSEFVEMFVGVGASRVRDLFDRAKAEAPAIVFIDEIDAVGRHRGAGLGGGHDEREQTLNQILVEMDGFETGTNVIIIAATNRPDILDPALLRPGRFDRKVTLNIPDIKGRIDILKVHAKGKPLAPDADLDAIARITAGFSGADLENLINEAAILSARRNLKTIGMSELQESMERVVMGPERKTRVISEKEKRILAYHEAGHAILQHVLEFADPVYKITIIQRGSAEGYVMSLPDDDRIQITRQEFVDRITAAMGGRAAEEIIFDQLSTGASEDLRQCTNLARAMVTQFGMSEKLGPRSYGLGEHQVFLGREIAEQRDYSDHYAEEIDNEVRGILQSAYDRAKSMLVRYHEKLDLIAKVLIEQETLDRQAFEELIGSNSPANG